MAEEEIVRILTRLGLTISQSKVHLALFELKKATGKITAKHSKVARQEAYRVLDELQEKGLVEKIIARPTEFEPIPIDDCIYILIKGKKMKFLKTGKKQPDCSKNSNRKTQKARFKKKKKLASVYFLNKSLYEGKKGCLRLCEGVLMSLLHGGTRTPLCLSPWKTSIKSCVGLLKFELSSTNLTKKNYYQTSENT
jgi:hypothetical protein